MIWAWTKVGKSRYKNAILHNLKEVRRFYSIWNISFISVTMFMCLFFWILNPEAKLPVELEVHGEMMPTEICFDVANCDRHVHCWDNKHIQSVVFAPKGFYPTEAMAIQQGQQWNPDSAQYLDVTLMVTRWFALGFVLSVANLAKEISHFCCWHQNEKEKIYDVHHYNRQEFRTAVKQFQDAIGGVLRILWLLWGVFIFAAERTRGCRGRYENQWPNWTGNYLGLSTLFYWIILMMYLIRPFVFAGYLCCRHKELDKKYNRKAQMYQLPSAKEEYDSHYKSIMEKKEAKKRKKNKL